MTKAQKIQCPQCSNMGVVDNRFACIVEENTNGMFYIHKCNKCQKALHIMSDKNNTMTWVAPEIKIYPELFKKNTIPSFGKANVLYVHLPGEYDNETSYFKIKDFLTAERMNKKYIVVVSEKISKKIKWTDYSDSLIVLPENTFFFGSFKAIPSAMAEEIVLKLKENYTIDKFFTTYYTFFDCFNKIPVEKIGSSDMLTNNKIYIGVDYENRQGI